MNLANNYIGSQIGKAKPPKLDLPIATVLDFVDKQIPKFVKSYGTSTNKNEKGLTQKLVRLLSTNLNDHFPFFFDKEAMEDESIGNSPSVDIGVITKESISVKLIHYSKGNQFFAFEAKILGVKESYRQKEYLLGYDSKGKPKNCGGIERFKKGIHGRKLNHAGMIGYIIKDDQKYWFNNINAWIDDLALNQSLIWNSNDKLNFTKSFKTYSKYFSQHSRINNTNSIKIFHFWINLN